MFKFLITFSFILSVGVKVFAEDRGGHCQPPSCAGLRGPFNSCAGKWVCGIHHNRYDRKELSPPYICLHDQSAPETKCKDGKEIPNTDTSENESEPNAS